MHVFLSEKVYKKMMLKWPKSLKSQKVPFQKLSIFVGQKSILHHCYIQNVRDRIQI